jgi:hypothetical protein
LWRMRLHRVGRGFIGVVKDIAEGTCHSLTGNRTGNATQRKNRKRDLPECPNIMASPQRLQRSVQDSNRGPAVPTRPHFLMAQWPLARSLPHNREQRRPVSHFTLTEDSKALPPPGGEGRCHQSPLMPPLAMASILACASNMTWPRSSRTHFRCSHLRNCLLILSRVAPSI